MTVYAIVHIDVHNDAEYAEYAKRAGPAVAQYGGEFLARGGATVSKEGTARARNVIVKFPDMETAEKFYHGPEYQEALSYALKDGVSDREYMFVEGV